MDVQPILRHPITARNGGPVSHGRVLLDGGSPEMWPTGWGADVARIQHRSQRSRTCRLEECTQRLSTCRAGPEGFPLGPVAQRGGPISAEGGSEAPPLRTARSQARPARRSGGRPCLGGLAPLAGGRGPLSRIAIRALDHFGWILGRTEVGWGRRQVREKGLPRPVAQSSWVSPQPISTRLRRDASSIWTCVGDHVGGTWLRPAMTASSCRLCPPCPLTLPVHLAQVRCPAPFAPLSFTSRSRLSDLDQLRSGMVHIARGHDHRTPGHWPSGRLAGCIKAIRLAWRELARRPLPRLDHLLGRAR